MAPRNRSPGRDVHVYDANDPSTVLGGLILANGITNANFYSMVEILVLFTDTFFLRDEDDTKIERDDHPLQSGKYYIVATGSFEINNEQWLLRMMSRQTGTRIQSFGNAVRSRDRRCVISGKEVPVIGGELYYKGFQAAHIFPLAYQGHWIENNYSRWITIAPANGGSINSVQNGLLLRSDIHELFDSYDLSINPDDNYKIILFMPDSEGLSGKHLDQRFLNDPQRPVDQLLRWHFRQAVLANMRGAGEPMFEHDFPPGSDMVGDILHGPKAAERMEFELFSRLGAQVELFPAAG
ncbi:hypothetical protein K432DRAFT_314066 [Lepidopterella palustris CBS 459.81]|uniref:HNH nuclease domain-containing protein n=1 Tax=Lepidopterella palustris CBS 459.81 TaxID=1314670 RepID=A0A8E2DWJ0_9PEZI|nr:hypothetical protein K432DRAFT_314066 [Lepidopterella palustris CBS 459.81]